MLLKTPSSFFLGATAGRGAQGRAAYVVGAFAMTMTDRPHPVLCAKTSLLCRMTHQIMQ